MDNNKKNTNMVVLQKFASHDKSIPLLIKQAAMAKAAEGENGSTFNDYVTRFGNWLKETDWKDWALGAGAAGIAGLTAHALQGKKKNGLLTAAAALAAGAPTVYFGPQIRSFASEQWNKWFPQKDAQNPDSKPADEAAGGDN